MAHAEHADWLSSLLQSLDRFGPEAVAAGAYIRQHGTRVSVHDQSSGARWTADRRIELHPHCTRLAPDHPDAIALVIHEVRHLQQGAFTALSVYGELEAWQLQFNFLKSVTGRYHREPGRAALIEQLTSLPLGWDRAALQRARLLMRSYAGPKYRIDLLPLYPIHLELSFHLMHHPPSGKT
jgi:hypothetical protein